MKPDRIIVPSRRSFLGGAALLLAAPAIVRASSLMPVSVPRPITWHAMDPDWLIIGVVQKSILEASRLTAAAMLQMTGIYGAAVCEYRPGEPPRLVTVHEWAEIPPAPEPFEVRRAP